MNFSFQIELYRAGFGGYIYSPRIGSDTQTELRKFLSNPSNQAAPEFDSLVHRLHQMCYRQGFRKCFFKMKESKQTNTIAALHYESQSLRLYCYHTSNMLIASGGGRKGEGPYQKYGECNAAVGMLEYIDCRFFERLKSKEIIIQPNGQLLGDLFFNSIE